jgi:hypothetical protein
MEAREAPVGIERQICKELRPMTVYPGCRLENSPSAIRENPYFAGRDVPAPLATIHSREKKQGASTGRS